MIECTKKYFGVGDAIDNWISQGKLEVVVRSGAEYMESLSNNGLQNTIGGIIVDCTDFVPDLILEGGPSAELFSPNFYNSINKLLIPGGFMSQQISQLCFTQGFIDRNTKGGFLKENITIFKCEVAEYGGPGFVPLGFSQKQKA